MRGRRVGARAARRAVGALRRRRGRGEAGAGDHAQRLSRARPPEPCSFRRRSNNNAMVGYNTAVGTLAEIAVDASQRKGRAADAPHHSRMRQHAGAGTGVGPDPGRRPPRASALRCTNELPLYEDGPGNGTWNFNRYHLPRGSDVAVWTQTAEVLPPLSDSEPPKGMAEVVMIPIMAAIVNGIAHAIGHRFRTLPVTPDQILEVLA